jgi:hypothetical protein
LYGVRTSQSLQYNHGTGDHVFSRYSSYIAYSVFNCIPLGTVFFIFFLYFTHSLKKKKKDHSRKSPLNGISCYEISWFLIPGSRLGCGTATCWLVYGNYDCPQRCLYTLAWLCFGPATRVNFSHKKPIYPLKSNLFGLFFLVQYW